MELKKPTQESTPSTSTAENKGGGITQTLNTSGVGMVKQSYADGHAIGQKANEAFALGLSRTRKAGAEQMAKELGKVNDATAAAIAAIDIEQVADEFGELPPFNMGSLSLLM